MNFKHLLLGLTILLLFGCVTYSKKDFRKEHIKLDVNELTKINGVYNFYPKKMFGKDYNTIPPDSLKYANLYQSLTDESLGIKSNPLRNDKHNYLVNLNLKNNNELNINVFENEIRIRNIILTGKLKNGMFYLNNKSLEFNGIPFLFGGYRSDKRRIGISKNNNLIINTAVGNEGAILFILGSGYQYNASYEYQRIN